MNAIDGQESSTLNRRQFVAAGGSGIAALALGGLGFSNALDAASALQFDASTPAAPEVAPAPPSGETVADVAARLNYDVEALFTFVRDEIHYEAYAGVLRGAKGTLWARAGNAADQAMLLSELLAAAQVMHRFAVGPLEPDHAQALTGQLTRSTGEAYLAYYEATVAASLHTLDLAQLPELDPAAAAVGTLAQFDESSQAAIDLAQASLETSYAAIADTLAKAGIDLPPLEPPRLPDRELNQHAWIQVTDGPDWIDYDPSLPHDTDAAGPPSPLETPDALPDDWHHHVKIAIAADDYLGGALARREVVAFTAASDHLVDVPIALSMAAPDDLSNLGLTLTELFTGQKAVFPSIYADGVTVDASQPLIFATGASTATDPLGGSDTSGDDLFGGTAGDGETMAVWLVAEITSPDEAPIVIERALLDRVPPEDRASGVIVSENITPVALVTNALGEETLEQFNVLPVIHTEVARMPTINAIARYTGDTVFGALGLLGPALSAFRDVLGEQEETRHGYWSYPSAPNLTVFHMSLPTSSDGEGRASIAVDMLHRRRNSLPLSDVSPETAVHPLVLSGVLEAVAEQTLLAPETRGDAADTSAFDTGPSVGGVFESAAGAGLEFRLLTSAADLASIEADGTSQAYMTAALDIGQYVVVPEGPVDQGGGPVLGWWIIDPATGRTHDQLQNGMAYASAGFSSRPVALFAQTGEYSFLTRAVLWIASNGRGFLCLGMGLSAGVVWACALIHGLNGGSAGRSAAAGGLASAGGVAGALAVC